MSDSVNKLFGEGGLPESGAEERAALRLVEASVLQLEQQHPEWWALYEEVNPDSAPRAEVVELMAAAPNEFARGLVYGKYLMRLEIAAITNRPWV